MVGKHTTPAMQARIPDAIKTPNLSKPPAKAVTISAATVFKKRELDTPQLRSTSRSPRKSIVRKPKKSHVDNVHPLALAFKESSEEYRRHLYANAVTEINKDLNLLLNKLYESNLQTASSDPADNDSQASPLKLTVPTKYQRLVQKLCSPLPNHCYTVQQMNTLGKAEKVHFTLHERFQSFEEKIQVETEEIKNLQRRWEGVVAEIFQVGVVCLGEDNMAALLSVAGPDVDGEKSTLFAPEHGSLTHKSKGKRKRVSFAGSDMETLFPGFLFHASEQQTLVSATPNLSAKAAQQIEQEIVDLGKQHVVDLQRLEKEHQAWWKKKQNQLAHTFLQD